MEGKIILEIFRAIDDVAKTMTSSADIMQMKTLFDHEAVPIFEQIKKWENE